MKLEWMREYRDVVEQLIHCCNEYASIFTKEDYLGTEVKISYAQVQVLEYLLENEDLHQNMATIATRLGITASTFSKLVNKLVDKNLLEKFHKGNNRKDVIVQVTDWGRKQYQSYSKYVYETHFSPMFTVADDLPKEYLPLVAGMLRAWTSNLHREDDELQKLVPIAEGPK